MNKTCPLCGAVLIPRFEIMSFEKNQSGLKVRYICPNCLPPDPEGDDDR